MGMLKFMSGDIKENARKTGAVIIPEIDNEESQKKIRDFLIKVDLKEADLYQIIFLLFDIIKEGNYVKIIAEIPHREIEENVYDICRRLVYYCSCYDVEFILNLPNEKLKKEFQCEKDEETYYIRFYDKNKEYILDYIKEYNANIFPALNKELRADYDIAMESTKRFAGTLQWVNDELKQNRELNLLAMKAHYMGIYFVHEKYRKDKEFVIEMIKTWKNDNCEALLRGFTAFRDNPEMLSILENERKKNNIEEIKNSYHPTENPHIVERGKYDVESLWTAVCCNDIEFVKNFLKNTEKRKKSSIISQGEMLRDCSLIMAALKNNNFEMAEILKKNGLRILPTELGEYKRIMIIYNYNDEITEQIQKHFKVYK